jgi:hypothetical protein
MVGAAIGLALACVQTAELIKSTLSRINEQAYEALTSVHDAVVLVSGVLEELRQVMSLCRDVTSETSLQGQIRGVAASCNWTLGQLQAEMNRLRYDEERHFLTRWRLFLGKESNLDKLLGKMRENKQDLSLLLQILTA